jgi:hypothetical protein
MAQVKDKNETREKVYNVETFIFTSINIPVLGVDEEDAKNNLIDLHESGYLNTSYNHRDGLMKDYNRFLLLSRGEGWVHDGELGPEMEVSVGNQMLRHYLLEQREETA